jgi:hypothetical protein
VLIWYRVGKTEGNGQVPVLIFGGLLQGEGDGGKWKGLSADVCWFGTGWRRRREMERVEC